MATLQGNQGQIGKTVGQNVTVGFGELSDVLVTELMARYYQNTYRGNSYVGANTAAQALSVASATFTGLAVSNPVGSGKNLVIKEVTVALAGATAGAGTIVLAYAPVVALTVGASAGPLSLMVGNGPVGVAKVGASATLGAAPTIIRTLMGITATTVVGAVPHKDDVGGSIIVPPGQLICIEATGTAVSIIGAITWDEVAI